VLALCAGCTTASSPGARGPVAVPAPSAPSAAAVTACRSLTTALPASLDKGVDRRRVRGDSALTAAWGDPPITLTCGVPPGDATQTPLVIDGLPLVTVEGRQAVTYTTVDRAVNVRLVMPKSYDEQAYLVQPLIPALKALPRN